MHRAYRSVLTATGLGSGGRLMSRKRQMYDAVAGWGAGGEAAGSEHGGRKLDHTRTISQFICRPL